jgi:uncharacterized membrane protein (GlpM family)
MLLFFAFALQAHGIVVWERLTVAVEAATQFGWWSLIACPSYLFVSVSVFPTLCP